MAKKVVFLRPLSAGQYATMLTVIVVPFLALILAFVFIRPSGLNIGIFISGWLITGFGITIGYHRYFTHGGFETSPAFEVYLGVTGLMSWMGTIREWVTNHLAHHEHSDTAQDLHSPHVQGEDNFGVFSGLVHAHIGWMLKYRMTNGVDYLPIRISENKTIKILDKLLPLWLGLSLAIPPIMGGMITQSWHGIWTAFVWGSLVRICFVHHITWCVNSVCHLWGSRPFKKTRDLSRNNIALAILALGEGSHNCHHRFIRSPKHGLLSGQIDPSWWVIRFFEIIGVVWKASEKVPSEERIKSALAE
ncbi:MAG: hypothetical protein A3I39_00530 [Candidatus Yanofskybacteria bacterium RIFCSPLOWO2_02_FULL_47_9b]|uniref:Fatty acid desaturase domain-containing protein n=1 Tax=Candidatus Yanofskybacteria bacterium RIFCSPLOWO2_02_FULL_47_9b TaxID=1802708 RepID=A0A1F8H793_9BACT|nr:MAG: hypothetical protein A3I39_00530 [Candidatus Yanofskybacteria bacterium RIFCSPLOWO2_02_FULL_47_9b]